MELIFSIQLALVGRREGLALISRDPQRAALVDLALEGSAGDLPAVGFTPAWARGTAARGTRTREQYRPHYSSTYARALVGILRTLVVFSLKNIVSQSLQMVLGVSP